MKINLKQAVLHTSVFIGGNLGTNLQIKNRTGLRLVYNTEDKDVYVYFNKEVGIIPNANVASMVPVNPEDLENADPVVPTPVVAPVGPAPTRKLKAQVSTPTSHVFAGEKQ